MQNKNMAGMPEETPANQHLPCVITIVMVLTLSHFLLINIINHDQLSNGYQWDDVPIWFRRFFLVWTSSEPRQRQRNWRFDHYRSMNLSGVWTAQSGTHTHTQIYIYIHRYLYLYLYLYIYILCIHTYTHTRHPEICSQKRPIPNGWHLRTIRKNVYP